MIFGLLRSWLRPILGHSLRSSRKDQYREGGLQTIGGGGADRSNRKSSGRPILSSVTFSNSEERIVDEMKMQEMQPARPDASSMGGILVSSRIDVTQEHSQSHSHSHSSLESQHPEGRS